MMQTESLQDRVRAAVLRALHLQGSPNVPLQMGMTPGWDSLGHMTVILEVEREFGMRVPVTRIAELTDVESILRVVSSRAK
jgi:acyl carrier protein